MQFTLLYSYDPAEVGPADEEVAAWIAFDAKLREAGQFVHEAGLHPAQRAQTVSVRDGRTVTEPGPAAPGRQVAGFYVVDVPDADTALAWAAQIPTAGYGTVEVRQVVEIDG